MAPKFEQHISAFYQAIEAGDVEGALLHLNGTILARDCAIDGLAAARRQDHFALFEALARYLHENHPFKPVELAEIFENTPTKWLTSVLHIPFDEDVLSRALFWTLRAGKSDNMEEIVKTLLKRPEGLLIVEDTLDGIEHTISQSSFATDNKEVQAGYQRARALLQAAIIANQIQSAGQDKPERRM